MKKSVVTLVALTLSSPLAMAKNGHKKSHHEKPQHLEQKKAQKDEKKSSHQRFSKYEHEIIQDYYYRHRYDSGRTTIPKGLKKKYKRTGELPPGWQMKVQRDEVLPKDIYAYAEDIPYALKKELPAGPIGSKIIELEGKVLRIMEGTRMVLDVFDIGRQST